MMHTLAFCTALVACCVTAPLTAQALSGRVLDDASGAPVAGSLIRLIAADGTRSGESLSDARGVFHVRTQSPGRYSVRIETLGYETYNSDAFSLDSSVIRDFRIAVRAIELPQLTSDGATIRCERRKEMSSDAVLVWEEIRKALALTSWTSSNATVEFTVAEQIRWFDTHMRVRGTGKPETTTGMRRGSPFAALQADSLLTKGFIQPAAGGHFKYFAPDGAMIMSDGFQATHCFHVVQDRKKPDLVGLGFEPAGDIKPYDVRGTLWMQRATGHLTRLEYSYDRLPVQAPGGAAGGEVDFARLDGGMWIVSGWALRVPIAVRANTPTGTRNVVTTIQERSQSVMRARIDGRVVYTNTKQR